MEIMKATFFSSFIKEAQVKFSLYSVISVSFLLILSSVAFPEDMFYWGNYHNGTICRGNQDGSGMEVIYDDFDGRGIAIDPNEGYIYWTDYYYNDLDQKFCQIMRARLDGSEQITLVEMESSSYVWEDVDIDLQNRKLYWADIDDYIYRSNLDGSGVEVFLSDIVTPHDIELDTSNNHIYWTSMMGGLWRADMDGTNQTLLESYYHQQNLNHIALDIQNGHVYLSRYDQYLSIGVIERMKLDGTDAEIIYTESRLSIKDILIHPVDHRLCIASYNRNTGAYIASCELDGTDFRYDIPIEPYGAWGLKLGPLQGLILMETAKSTWPTLP